MNHDTFMNCVYYVIVAVMVSITFYSVSKLVHFFFQHYSY